MTVSIWHSLSITRTAYVSDLPPVIRPPVLLVRMLQEPVADSPRRCGAGRDYRSAASKNVDNGRWWRVQSQIEATIDAVM